MQLGRCYLLQIATIALIYYEFRQRQRMCEMGFQRVVIPFATVVHFYQDILFSRVPCDLQTLKVTMAQHV